MISKQLTHGGKRVGAGRKQKFEEIERHTVTLLPEDVHLLKQLGAGNLSAGIRKAIESMNSKAQQITVQELRQIFFEIADQEMTIQELRIKLFGIENQHKYVTIGAGMWKELGIQR